MVLPSRLNVSLSSPPTAPPSRAPLPSLGPRRRRAAAGQAADDAADGAADRACRAAVPKRDRRAWRRPAADTIKREKLVITRSLNCVPVDETHETRRFIRMRTNGSSAAFESELVAAAAAPAAVRARAEPERAPTRTI